MCISVILYSFISTFSFRFKIFAKKAERRLTEILKCVPQLHILSTESKETIQHKLQNGDFMFRKHSHKPSMVVLFNSTIEKQNRNELKNQPSSFTSCRGPRGIHQLQSACEAQRGNLPIAPARRQSTEDTGEQEGTTAHQGTTEAPPAPG